jgi:hypothetical protein
LIIKQISQVKSKLVKHLDDLEERLITEVASVQEKNEEKIKREKDEMSQLRSVLKENKQELEFFRGHGSNNQLFLVLRKQITNISVSGLLLSSCTCGCCTFIDLYLIGQGRVICETDPIVSMLKFLISSNSIGEQYDLRGMAVTSDNKLLLCNYKSSHPKVYIYKEYKTYEDEISFRC